MLLPRGDAKGEQVGKPERQIPTEGNPPAVLAPQRSASWKSYSVRFNGLRL
ncbi:MAG: hypothetical protein KME49_24825 [Brasilonema octagenarum HA4186-MV1]|jgi:hypothetical protein|nr:hypothetical protein [Brasilonema octagenarum HA4186-MV1]